MKMQIETAIEYTRDIGGRLRELGRTYERDYNVSIAAQIVFRDAEALETVCDALEGFLAKQEEDNSYHSK